MDKREEFRQRYGPWAVIAGGTEGFGLAWTRAVAALGINTLIVARRKELLEKTAAEIAGRFGVETVPVECDLSLPEASSIVAAAAAEYEIGLVVYNACESIIGPFLSKSGDEHRKVIDTNCRGPLEFVHHFGQRMVDQRRGGNYPDVEHELPPRRTDGRQLCFNQGFQSDAGPESVARIQTIQRRYHGVCCRRYTDSELYQQ